MSESMPIATLHDLVEALGGNIALARMLRIEPNNISMWFTRGSIPKGWHLPLVVEVKRLGLTVDPDLFDLTDEQFDVLMARPTVSPAVPPPAVPPDASSTARGRSRRVA